MTVILTVTFARSSPPNEVLKRLVARHASRPADGEATSTASKARRGDSANPETRKRQHSGTYYIKTAADDVRKAMTALENHIGVPVQSGTQGPPESSLVRVWAESLRLRLGESDGRQLGGGVGGFCLKVMIIGHRR